MHRIFCFSQDIVSDRIKISDRRQVHHLKDVLRLRINDKIKVLDDKGKEYDTVIEKFSLKNMVLKIIPFTGNKGDEGKGKINITIACAIPKNAGFDDIVDKLTQLGVDRIIPLDTERVVVKLDKGKALSRFERWTKIAENAASQSQRRTIPVIEPLTKIDGLFLESDKYDLKLIPTLEGNRKTLREVLERNKPQDILIIIGPEGDFSPAEVNNAIKAGFIPVSLGDTVLRVDTAAIAITSYLKLHKMSITQNV